MSISEYPISESASGLTRLLDSRVEKRGCARPQDRYPRSRVPKRHLSDYHRIEYLSDEREFTTKVKTLSDAHLEILALVARGYLNKQIANARGSSEATVKSQQKEILRRLGLSSRTQAAVKFAIYCDRSRHSADVEEPN